MRFSFALDAKEQAETGSFPLESESAFGILELHSCRPASVGKIPLGFEFFFLF